jgi:tetratricopeptide (TPR) repeat protein
MRTPAAVSLLLLAAPAGSAASPPVTVREEKLAIPTWQVGPPSVHPSYPGPQGVIYPYTLNDVLTDRKADRAYDAVWLENEYVQMLILPEIGGRVHGALDKTNGYRWLYWQPTIKPGLIGMTGAWISGGIEWNFPHGHRPSGFMPVDHRVVRHEDGSATVWVGETEPVYGTRWLVGMTLEPGKSRLRCDYVFVNPTSHRRSFQFWATSATHANEWSQAQYPGEIVAGHGKTEFWHWPVHDGVDLTWWKNVANASSFFAWQSRDDWFGTYDHRAGAGLVHVADHRVMPGKKLWTWGSGPSGRIWEEILTEGGGPYFEPQAGAWSDNQPDYHWMAPHEVRRAHDYWYPVRDIRGFQNANPDFAVQTDLRDGKAFAGVHATSAFDGLTVVLRDARDGRVLSETQATISPDRPLLLEAKAPRDATVHDLQLAVSDAGGRTLIELQRRPPRETPLPAPQEEWGDPGSMTPDQLFHCGEWLDRFRRTPEALRCYEEALERDPGDTRVHLEMGFLALKQARFEDAMRSFDAAARRDAGDARLHHGRALAALGLGRLDDAYESFRRASFSGNEAAAARLGLARLELGRRRYEAALDWASLAEALNGAFADVPALAALAHRGLGQTEKALLAAERALALDPMHFMAAREKALALRALGRDADSWEKTRISIMRGAVQNAIELSAGYADAGLFADADAVLGDFLATSDAGNAGPMLHYLRGSFCKATGDDAAAAGHLRDAAASPFAGALPHRLVEKRALEQAIAAAPRDAAAHHLLGNLLYGLGQREEGLRHWKEAVRLNDGLALAWRNVGYALAQLERDDRSALVAYDRAFSLDPNDARVLLERDQVAERLRLPGAERRGLLERNGQTVDARDDLLARFVDLLLDSGNARDLEQAERILAARHFHTWEGAYGLHHAWVEAQQKLGDRALAEGNREQALRHYERALEYPKNLEVAPRTPDLRAHVWWSLAKAQRGSQRTTLLKRILGERYPRPSLGTYYQALARKGLGQPAEARALLDHLEQEASRDAAAGAGPRRQAIGHYLLSLVRREEGDVAGADANLARARELDPHPERRALTRAQIEYAGGHQ